MLNLRQRPGQRFRVTTPDGAVLLVHGWRNDDGQLVLAFDGPKNLFAVDYVDDYPLGVGRRYQAPERKA